MRLRSGRGPLTLLPLLVGCGTSLYLGDIAPPAQSRPATAPIYVQAREFAVEEKWTFLSRAADRMAGYTLDIHNRSGQAVALRLSQAVHRVQQIDGPLRAEARAIASGAGSLPPYLSAQRFVPGDVSVPPGAKQTLWILFAPLVYPPGDEVKEELYRELLVIPAAGGPDLTLKLDDPGESPRHRRRLARIGVSLVSSTRQFSAADLNLYSPIGPAVWYLHGRLKTTLSYGGFALVEESTPPVHAQAYWAALDAQWVPWSMSVGGYLGATVLGGDLQETRWATDGARFSAEVGLVFVPLRTRGVPFSFRLGYSRLFDVPTAPDGVTLGLEIPLIWF